MRLLLEKGGEVGFGISAATGTLPVSGGLKQAKRPRTFTIECFRVGRQQNLKVVKIEYGLFGHSSKRGVVDRADRKHSSVVESENSVETSTCQVIWDDWIERNCRYSRHYLHQRVFLARRLATFRPLNKTHIYDLLIVKYWETITPNECRSTCKCRLVRTRQIWTGLERMYAAHNKAGLHDTRSDSTRCRESMSSCRSGRCHRLKSTISLAPSSSVVGIYR